MEYERITCDDVEVGDMVAHAKTHEFRKIERIDEGPVSRRLHWSYFYNQPDDDSTYIGDGSWRPRRTTKLWREVHR